MGKRITTIKVSEETWRELRDRKALGETFDSTVRRILGLEEEKPEPKGSE